MTLQLYTLILRLLLPAALLRLYWRSLKAPAYRHRISERLALDQPAAPPAAVWVHAVSVGEVQAAQPLIKHLLSRDPPLAVLVTTTTPTGAARVQDLFGAAVTHRYTPYDLPEVIARFLDRVEPRLLIVMETEIWPNTLAACAARGIPTVLANARLSARSARGYARLARLTRDTLERFTLIAAQTEADARRFRDLGAAAQRVVVTGSIKFDLRPAASLQDQSEAMRRSWGGGVADRPVWVAASTHEGEEELMLAAHRQIRAHVPAVLLVLVPRHPERFERVAGLIQRAGFPLTRRSARVPCPPETAVFLGDSMGELPIFLAAADAAFIGGSLVPTGGHNPLEAAAVGVPVAIGPAVFNFAAITELLVTEGAAVQVANAPALAAIMIDWLTDASLRADIGEHGRRVVEANRGALQRLLGLIEGLLSMPDDTCVERNHRL
ncbi:MAG: lipid IV(A) 3-deoxy-D-manno-octulosonic acid transferase [Lamprocystis purpurea]|jgi:3-deoxy-D-manno-octulosonic-acid transferase|uniref:lipid IV(A) 3-deoxy-D-manno-octulosonic acid transferase n=1 Tax=Lamprocystis purpurea TaxID=61598 RepID=UPI00035F8853|nr:lipid IV(A) 3-deoxy-D-manno-octulosonic acid transferase [Lamprocystis purpurea]MBV5273246.1 lipid IV(A) 3-deoxy-D-manno-octulosonic acid transferase [Lamprocystis purpurea]